MKIVQVVAKPGTRLKSELKNKERELRGRGTFYREREGRWKHVKYHGWIDWSEPEVGLLVARVQTKKEGSEWQLLQAFIGYLDRNLGDKVESISIHYR